MRIFGVCRRTVSLITSWFSLDIRMTVQSIAVLSIIGQHKFYATLSNFLGIIGYRAGEISKGFQSSATDLLMSVMNLGALVSIVCVEHLYFRNGSFARYDLQSWNVPSQLPLGAAALGACILSFAFVVPSMSQVWYTGPIARKTGDIGFEMATIVTALLYIPLRHLEKQWRGV